MQKNKYSSICSFFFSPGNMESVNYQVRHAKLLKNKVETKAKEFYPTIKIWKKCACNKEELK